MSGAPVELEVQQLEELGRSGDAVIMRASGRAWSAVAQMLTPPVLVAGNARVIATGGATVVADDSGPSWSAEFRVPAAVAAAATHWAVETEPTAAAPPAAGPRRPAAADLGRLLGVPRPIAPPPSPKAAPLAPPPRPRRTPPRRNPPPPPALPASIARLGRVPGMLGELSEGLGRLERRSVELAELAARTRAADAQRVAAAEAARAPADEAAQQALRDELRRVRAERDRARQRLAELTATGDAEPGLGDRAATTSAGLARARAALPGGGAVRDVEAGGTSERAPVPRPSRWNEPQRFPHVSPSTPGPTDAPPESSSAPEDSPRATSADPPPPAPAEEAPHPALPHPPASPDPETASSDHRSTPVDGTGRSTSAASTDAPAPRRRRRLGVVAGVVGGAGVLLVAEAATTAIWQEPVTAVLAARSQADLREEQRGVAGRLARDAPPPREGSPASARMAQLAISQRSATEPGDPIGRLRIPRVGGSWIVVAGAEPRQLRKGPGLVAGSSLPGRRATTTISGRTTTFGAPFRELDEIAQGDRLELEMPYGTFVYEVERSETAEASTTSSASAGARLVLTAPASRLGGDGRRVVVARQVEAAPRGPAA